MIKENPIYNLHTKKTIHTYKKENNNIKYEMHIKYTIKQKLYNMGITRGRNLLDSTNTIYVYLNHRGFQVLRP